MMQKYNGKIIQRIRPTADAFISGDEKKPYEIHFMSFDSQSDLDAYLKDDTRLKYVHLKGESVETMLLVKAEKM